MSVAELPSKLVESAATLTQTKMTIACELIKISYREKVSLEILFKDYTDILNSLKDISSSETVIQPLKKHYILSIISIIMLICLLGVMSYIIFIKYEKSVFNILMKIVY